MPDWEREIRKRTQEIQLFVAAQMQTNRAMLFDRAGSYNGHSAWEPLKFRKGVPLSDRGTLRKSLASDKSGRAGPDGVVRFSGSIVTIATNLVYAGLMNDGTTKMPDGVLRPVNARALKIPLPKGKNATDVSKGLRKSQPKGQKDFMFRAWVRIPARPFDTWTKQDEDEMSEALMNKLVEIMSGTSSE